MKIVFATGNKDKLKQIKLILDDIDLLAPADLGIENFEVTEDGTTLEANAYKKAKALYDKTKERTLADDTGLFVEALDGRPGVFSHRYAGEDASYKDNRDKLLGELAGIENRAAYFKTVICYIDKNGTDHYFEGTLVGEITETEIGDYEFGYDQIFLPLGSNKTLGQLTPAEINEISHRSKALEKFKDYLRDNDEDTNN